MRGGVGASCWEAQEADVKKRRFSMLAGGEGFNARNRRTNRPTKKARWGTWIALWWHESSSGQRPGGFVQITNGDDVMTHHPTNPPDAARRRILAALAGSIALSACGGGGSSGSGSPAPVVGAI